MKKAPTEGKKISAEEQSELELVLCELRVLDCYTRIKALYCSDQFSRDEAGWQALIDRAWGEAMANDAERRRRGPNPVAERARKQHACENPPEVAPEGARLH